MGEADDGEGGDVWDAAVGEPGTPPPPVWSPPAAPRPARAEATPAGHLAGTRLRAHADPDHPPWSRSPYGVESFGDRVGADLHSSDPRLLARRRRRLARRRAKPIIVGCLAVVGGLICVGAYVDQGTSTGPTTPLTTPSQGQLVFQGQGALSAPVGRPISTTSGDVEVESATGVSFKVAPVTATVSDVVFTPGGPDLTGDNVTMTFQLCSPATGVDLTLAAQQVQVYDSAGTFTEAQGSLPGTDVIPPGGCRTTALDADVPDGSQPVSIIFGDHRRAEWLVPGARLGST